MYKYIKNIIKLIKYKYISFFVNLIRFDSTISLVAAPSYE